MGNYQVQATFVKDQIYLNQVVPQPINIDFNEAAAPGAASTFLASLASCKLVSLLELKEKYKMQIDEAQVLVNGVTGRGELIEGTHIPSSRFLSIEFIFRVKSNQTDEELWDYLKYVNGACTMGNSLSEKIDINYRIDRI